LEQNAAGHLYTIDLPPPTAGRPIKPAEAHSVRPAGLTTNWCVPDRLRERQTLLVGTAQEHLEKTLGKLGQVDVFLHDSDHSYEHMLFELATALPFVRRGGYLWADDINTNTAWSEFCARHELPGTVFGGQGVVRKP
jgi:hypothetical protein